MDTLVPAKSRLRLVLLAAAALALLATLVLAAPRANASARIFFPSKCNNSAYKPLNITVTCADGKISFQTTHWNNWGLAAAHTTGGLIYPECGDQPLVSCNNYDEASASITLSVPIACGRRLQYTRMVINAPKAPNPALRSIRQHIPCGGVG